MTMFELLESGELDGYENAVGNDIDWDVATRTPCPNCGGRCEYVAMRNDNGSYRAFAVCQKCQAAHEF